ncbi:MAG: hypothetical protein FJZ01_25240, partial [Candidatus Sericytochromatia bacterium]|nr:hypothetical protein [Candidatus Tanganyikabacteria bacterium]
MAGRQEVDPSRTGRDVTFRPVAVAAALAFSLAASLAVHAQTPGSGGGNAPGGLAGPAGPGTGAPI